MSARRMWVGAAKLIVNAFNAMTSGLTASMPSDAAVGDRKVAVSMDRNVDMLIGGQAVIEGVMMRSLSGYSIAVRQPNGGIAIKKDKLSAITKKYPFLRFPVLRGSLVLIPSLYLRFQELNVENARKKSTLHPRCGTSFLLFVMAISIAVFSLIPSSAHFAIKFGARVVLIPLIAGLAYEVIRFSARHLDSKACRALIQPGLWLQRITTKEPDDQQLEIAIVALKTALAYDVVEPEQAAVAQLPRCKLYAMRSK